MTKVSLSDEMLELLSSIKGKIFKSYEIEMCFNADFVEDIIRINLGKTSINIFNKQELFNLIDGSEELGVFSCKQTDEFPYEKETKQYLINEKIKNVYIVRDTANYKNGEYILEVDHSIIIETEYHKYAFCRNCCMFSDFTKILIDAEIDCLIDEKEVKEYFNADEVEATNVVRTRIEL